MRIICKVMNWERTENKKEPSDRFDVMAKNKLNGGVCTYRMRIFQGYVNYVRLQATSMGPRP